MNGFKVTLNADGSVSVDSRSVKGSASEIERELNLMANAVGGELVIEKHVHGAHAHDDGRDHDHTHG